MINPDNSCEKKVYPPECSTDDQLPEETCEQTNCPPPDEDTECDNG